MSTFTVITSTAPKNLTKQYSLDSAGVIQRKTSANMYAGEAEQKKVTTASDFAGVLQSLGHDQALCYGVADAPKVRILSRAEYEKQGRPADAITRTKDRLKWPQGGGVLMLDYDPQDGQQTLSRVQLLEALAEVIPELTSSAYVWWCSSSSLIYNDQEQLHGVRGQRVYILVQDAKDIPRAGDVLFKRLWLAGHGFYMISRAGTALERTPIDASVWQTNRLDFAAGAQCTPPLEQLRGVPEVTDGELLDTVAALPDLTPEEETDLQALKDKLAEDMTPEVEAARYEYVEAEAEKMLERAGADVTDESLEQARATITRAVQGGVLAGDFVITLDDNTEITIGEVLDSPSKYHNRLTLDPLEPEYNGFKVVGRLYLMGGTANLYSQAHGGKNYRLIRQPRKIQHNKGATAETARNTLEFLRQLPDVFDMNSPLVVVQDGKARVQNIHSFSYWLGGVAQFYCVKKKPRGELYEEALDPPVQMLNQLLAIGEGRRLKQLKAVITAPVMTKDMRIINRVGYDAKTQLYLDMPQDALPIPEIVMKEMAIQALDVLMRPFNGFMTATPLDKGVLLAAVLTAVQRPVLPTAPAFGLDAPVQGTGKTYLAQCLGALATGETPTVYPHTVGRDDEEVRKRLTTVLASGARVLVWDNVLGAFDSVAMASLLTTEVFNDRILGKSEAVSIPSRILMLLTGNNLTLAGDMPRRVLKCRLDAQVANPASRKFDSDPLEYIKKHRRELVQAALTLIKGYLQSNDCMTGGAVQGESTASFEDWDYMIRQTVAWVAGTLNIDGYGDPAQALKDAIAIDPEAEALGEVLEGIEAVMGESWFYTKELYRRVTGGGGFDSYAHPENEELNDALMDMNGGRPLTVKGLGRILSYRVDRIVDGRKLKSSSANRRTRYKLEKTG